MGQTFSVAVSAVIKRDDKVLLLKRSPKQEHAPGLWDPCSGRIESGETPKQAVVREAREETGLIVEPLRVIDTFHFLRGPQKEESIGITFLCRAGEGDVVLSHEHTEARWVAPDALDDYEMADGLKEILTSLTGR